MKCSFSYKSKDLFFNEKIFFEFFTPALLIVSHWSLNDSKSPHVFRTLLNILADLNNPVACMVSAYPLICKSFSPFINSFSDFIDCTNSNWYHHHFHVPQFFFNSQRMVRYWSFFFSFFVFFQFYSVISWYSKIHNSVNFSFSNWLLLSLIIWPRLGDPFVSQNPIGIGAYYRPGQILGSPYFICLHSQISIIIIISSSILILVLTSFQL